MKLRKLLCFFSIISLTLISYKSFAQVSAVLPVDNPGDFVLIDSRVVERSGQANTTTSYRTYLTHAVSNFEPGDVFVIHAAVEGTYQSASGVKNVSTLYAYLDCNGARVSPYRLKSLKRSKGNHHGAAVLRGVCHVSGNNTGSVTISLKARISRVPGIIHFGGQSKLIVNHYRSAASHTGDNWSPVRSFSADNSGSNFYFQNPSDPYATRYDLLETSQSVEAEDYVYLSAQGSAEKPNPKIPMFGFELLSGSDRLGVATENVIYSQLYRVNQYLVNMWQAPAAQNQRFSTRVYGLESGGVVPRMLARRSFSSLQGIVFRKGQSQDSLLLKNIDRSVPASDAQVRPNNVQTNFVPQQTIVASAPGFMRIKAFATVKYQGTDVRSCYVRIAVSKDGAPETVSSVSGRQFNAPYVYHNVSNEWIYPIEVAGSYRVRPYFYCSTRAKNTPLTLMSIGSWSYIDHFEKPID